MARRPNRRLPDLKSSALLSPFKRFGVASYTKTKYALKRGVILVEKRPLTSFFSVLALLFVLILIGFFLRQPKKEMPVAANAKNVQVYSIGQSPKINVAAVVEKSGVIKIVALSSGVVSSINVTEGEEVGKGTTLVSLATNYSGGNAPDIQRQLAEATLSNVKDTYDQQKDLIKKQKELADKNRDNTEQLRSITADSLDATRNLLSLNQGIVDTLNSNLTTLSNNNSGGANDAAILQTKQLISQFQSAVNQLQTGVKTTEYQTDKDNAPTAITDLMHDITEKQLDIQNRALQLSLESSQLQLKLAQVQEATMFPSAPFSGVIERIYVNPGENVNPGTPLVLLHGAQTLKVVAKVPASIARLASYTESSRVHIGDKTFNETPVYISTEATDGSLYSILYKLPDEFQNKLSDNEFIEVELPVGYPDTTTAVPFVPIDSVFQSQSSAYLFVSKNGKATPKKITLGDVMGDYVQVQTGLTSGDHVILDRSVISGDKVKESL